MNLKELIANLVKQEFGELVLDIRFRGPYAEEDIVVDVILKELPKDIDDKEYRIWRQLNEKSLDVLIGYGIPVDEFEAVVEEYIERREKDIKTTIEKISENLHRFRKANMEEKTIEVDGTIVDGKLTLSLQNDSYGRIKIDGNEIITPYERIVLNIKP